VEKALTSNIDYARELIMLNLTDIMNSYKAAFTSSGQSSQLIIPENLKLLPILTLGLLKSVRQELLLFVMILKLQHSVACFQNKWHYSK
jgi:hypothetical protein